MNLLAVATTATETQVGYLQAIYDSWIAWIIILLSIGTMTLIIFYFLDIRHATKCPQELYLQVSELLDMRMLSKAEQVLAEDPSPLARVVEAGLIHPGTDRAQIAAAMSEAGSEQSLRLQQRVSYLALIAAVAPMLGLLGTVAGMIEAFAALPGGEAAGGISSDVAISTSKALVTTFLGLSLAIPTMAVHLVLRNRVNIIMLRIADMAEALLPMIIKARSGQEKAADRRG